MRKYPITFESGYVSMVPHIGANHSSNGAVYGGNASSYDRAFDDEDSVCIQTGIGDIRHCIIGDIKEAYLILREEIKAKKPSNIFEYALCVQNTVMQYFGDFSKYKDRLSYFPSDEDIDSGKEIGKVSSLAHKNAALCVERAMLSQNLLMEIGIKSTFKVSGILLNDVSDVHAYNVISHDGKYYIFDVTMPTMRNDKINPIICEIPKEVYDKIIKPNHNIGESVMVTHFNPLQNVECSVVYDAGRENTYKLDEVLTKR